MRPPLHCGSAAGPGARAARAMPDTVRKPCTEQRRPTRTPERERERVLWRCRVLYHTALEQSIVLWNQRGVSSARQQQEAEPEALRADLPDASGTLHSHIRHNVAVDRRIRREGLPQVLAFRFLLETERKDLAASRSEERRVGKESRYGRTTGRCTKR